MTILLSRMQWAQTLSCQPLAGTVDIDEVAEVLRARNIAATGTVVINDVGEIERKCVASYTMAASWADLARLRDEYGWSFISHSFSYPNMTTLSVEQQQQESCGTLPVMEAHGHDRAWGMFAYPNNRFNQSVQRLVAGCFAYGRVYDTGVNPRSSLTAPWVQKTLSINGGKCESTTDPCASVNAPSQWGGYADPSALAAAVKVQGETWGVLQAYRFARGSRLSGAGARWDCTGTDWRTHWTSAGELYCWDDFLSVIDQVDPVAEFVDPASVAEAWGRSPGYDAAPETSVTAPSQSQQLPPGQAMFAGTATDDRGVAAVRIAVQDTATKQWWHSDGTWGAYSQSDAILDAPNAQGTSWTFAWPSPRIGTYAVQAIAADAAGQVDTTPGWKPFRVVDPTDALPDSSVVSPVQNQKFSLGQATLAGTATDDRGVTAVRIAVQDTATKQWWHSDGTWGSFSQYEATLDNPGTNSTGWTYQWMPPAKGRYALQVTALDTHGRKDGSPPWVNFQVV